MSNVILQKKRIEQKFFVLIFIIAFIIFSFTSHGHRTGPDEYYAFVQASQIANLKPAPDMIPAETRIGLEGGGPWAASRLTCQNGILCALTPIGYATTFIPFILIEQNFHVIPNYEFTIEDFDDPHYVLWRNSLPHEETFTFLFYGPVITSLSVGVVYLICRSYSYSQKISVIISFLYGFTTIAWVYSTTGFNGPASTLFILLGFLFFRKFKNNDSSINLVFAGSSLGFGFLVRYDVIIFTIILLAFLITEFFKKPKKWKNFTSIFLPLVIFFLIFGVVNTVRWGSFFSMGTNEGEVIFSGYEGSLPEGFFGLLFSPGAGIFIFSPILLSIFVSFRDFFKIERKDLIMFLTFLLTLLIFYGGMVVWHGFVSWSARYMIQVIPFLLIPLGASIYARGKVFRISILVLAIIGAFFNFAGTIQDVTWFVWGHAGGTTGLYSLATGGRYAISVHPAVIWTFEYSQLTHAILLEFTKLQTDLFLLKILGPITTSILVGVVIIPCVSTLLYFLKVQDRINVRKEQV